MNPLLEAAPIAIWFGLLIACTLAAAWYWSNHR